MPLHLNIGSANRPTSTRRDGLGRLLRARIVRRHDLLEAHRAVVPAVGYGLVGRREPALVVARLSPATALKMWMRSPEHRANILNPNWREIGIAAVHVHGAPGTFGGLPVTIITTDFGVRRQLSPPRPGLPLPLRARSSVDRATAF